MKSGIITRRVAGAGAALALVVGLAGCNVHLEGHVSEVDISRTCLGEPDHHGTVPHRTQVTVTVSPSATENHHILISLNDGEQTTGLANVEPGSGLILTDHEVNTTEVDVAVVPSDGVPDADAFDTYHQTFNAC